MRATGSRSSRRAASAASAARRASPSGAVAFDRQRGVIEAERVAGQQARVELGRVEAGLRGSVGQRAARLRRRVHVPRVERAASIAFGRQQLGLMVGDQRVDDLAQRLALHHLRQVVERQVDAVVGDAALREVVGADALGAVARADLVLALGGARLVALGLLGVVELGAQHRHRLGAVLVLRALLLHHHDDAARHVGDADRGFGLVDVLAAGALRSHGVDLEVVRLDLDVDVLDLGQHRDGRGRGVDAALRLGVGHALDAVHAGLELQPGERPAAPDLGDDFLEAALGALGEGEDFGLSSPAARQNARTCGTGRRRTARPRRRRCRRGFRR